MKNKLFLKLNFALACLIVSLSSISASAQISAVAFGDSITQGYQRAEEGGSPYRCADTVLGNRTTSCGYVDELTALFNNGSKFYNWGWHGEAVTFDNLSSSDSNYVYSSGLDRFRDLIDNVANQIDYALIMEGTNDIPRSVSTGQIADYLEQMIEYSVAKGVKPVIATIPPRIDARRDDSKVTELNEKIEALADEHNIPLADQFNALGGFSGFDNYDSGDHLHVGEAGYDLMAAEWYRAITEGAAGNPSDDDDEEEEEDEDGSSSSDAANLIPIMQLLLL